MTDEAEDLSLKEQAKFASADQLYNILLWNYDNMDELPGIIKSAAEDCASLKTRRTIKKDYHHRTEKEKVLIEFLNGTDRFAEIQAERNYLDKIEYLSRKDKKFKAVVNTERSKGTALAGAAVAPYAASLPARGKNNKTTEIVPPEYADFESGLAAKIEDAEKIVNPVKQLLKYQAIKEEYKNACDPKKVVSFEREHIIRNGKALWGFYGYLAGGEVGTFAAIAVASLIGGIAAVLLVPFIAGGILAGCIIGKKRGQRAYRKRYSAEQKHHTRLSEMLKSIDRPITQLQAFLKQDKGYEFLKNAPECMPEIGSKFADIKTEFERRAAIDADRAQISARNNDAAPRQLKAPRAAR